MLNSVASRAALVFILTMTLFGCPGTDTKTKFLFEDLPASFTTTVTTRDSSGVETPYFLSGAAVTIDCSIQNQTAKTLTLAFSTPNDGEVEIYSQSNSLAWQLSIASPGNMLTGRTTTIAPGATYSFSASWSQTNTSGGSVPDGTYLVRAWMLAEARDESGAKFVIPTTPLKAIEMGSSQAGTGGGGGGGGSGIPFQTWVYSYDSANIQTVSFPSGQNIRFELSIKNISGVSQAFDYAAASAAFAFRVLDLGTEVKAASVAVASQVEQVSTGSVLKYSYDWDQLDTNGLTVVAKTYVLEVLYPTGSSVSPAAALPTIASVSFTILPGGTAGSLSPVTLAKDTSGVQTSSFIPGDTVDLQLSLTNGYSETKTISYTSDATYTVTITDALGATVRTLTDGTGAGPTAAATSILPGQTAFYNVNWDQLSDGGVQVPGGNYTVTWAINADAGSASLIPTLPPATVTIISGTSSLDYSVTLDAKNAQSLSTRTFTVNSAAQDSFVKFELAISNLMSSTSTLTYDASANGYKWDVIVRQGSVSGTIVFQQSASAAPTSFAGTTASISAGHTLSLFGADAITWSLVDGTGAPAVSSGTYFVSMTIAGSVSAGVLPVTLPTLTLSIQ
ncbi:MAG: BsuPI-related putative proteinase inhibitor [Planctomycetes bacterium]|nr:BsuPI-related putative proteinase inhibitor [Planctomycetota bacterium]